MTYKILIVEDDFTIANICKNKLQQWGYEVEIVEDFHHVLDCFLKYQPELVLMDVNLPCFNGYKWCNDIRQKASTPIIFISSLNDDMNMVMAMELGADDFICKPFSMEVLIAKVQALLRRTYAYQGQSTILKYRDLSLNLDEATLIRGDLVVELSKNEFKIFKELLKNKGKIVSREQLMYALWSTDEFIDDNTLTVNINRLRNRLKTLGLEDVIVTKKSMGYLLNNENSD